MKTWLGRGNRALRTTLVEKIERDHREDDRLFLRRRIVVAVVTVVGAVLLGFSLSTEPGDTLFYPLTLALAATWVVGGLASGRLHLGWTRGRDRPVRPIVVPILLGLAVGAVFIVGALIVREIEPLRQYVEDVLAFARFGSLPLVVVVTLLNGIAEEVFFRGGLYAAIGVKHPVAISTGVYALATLASGNPMLVFAALFLGTVLGLERRASGGILAPILTHITWSLVMLLVLPPVFAAV